MAKKENTGKKEKSAVATGPVRQQFAPFYKVVTGGVVVDYTDKLSEASTVYREAAARPKFIYKIGVAGDVSCVGAQY